MSHILTVSNYQVCSANEFNFGLCTQVSDSGPYGLLVPVCSGSFWCLASGFLLLQSSSVGVATRYKSFILGIHLHRFPNLVSLIYTVELLWLDHLWNHENMFEKGSSS